MAHLLRLKSNISRNHNTEPDDILSTKWALNRVGSYDVPEWGMTSFGDENLFSGIRKYQKVRGLSVDGIMNPNGETERDLNRTLNELELAAQSPTQRCVKCGEPHGGAFGKFCWWCWLKMNS
jgi:hypothetical protein